MSDLFISYSRSDLDWAARVDQLLHQRLPTLSTFFDQNSLRAGDDWEAKIEAGLRSAKHFLVLWSEYARLSDWVNREFWTYAAQARPIEDTTRRLVCVNLKGENSAAKAYQQVDRAWLQGAYPDAQALTPQQWTQLTEAIVDALDPSKQSLQVPLVVLTITKAQLAALPAQRWQQIEQDFNIPQAALLDKYGARPLDWQPFAQNKAVIGTFDEVLDRVNAALKRHKLSWRLPDESFWSDLSTAKKFVDDQFSTARLSVLVIDPVAIHDQDIFQRLMLFQDAMASSGTVIVTLAPFGAPENLVRLRTALIQRGMPYFTDYFQRTVPSRRKLVAQCGWNVSDWDDVQRHILAAADNLVAEGATSPSPTFLRYGSSQQ